MKDYFEQPIDAILDGCNRIVWNSSAIKGNKETKHGISLNDRGINITDAVTGIRRLVAYIEMQLEEIEEINKDVVFDDNK